MGNLVKMDLYKLKKFKMFFVFAGIILAATIILPILGKVFSDILLNLVKTTGDVQAAAEAQMVANAYQIAYPLSGIFRSPMGGLSILWVLVFVSASSFSYLDLANGYVKNIAGQVPSHGYLAVSKMIVIAIHNLIFMVVGLIGSLIGYGVTQGLTADEALGEGILEFFLKFLLASGLTALLLLFTTGFGKKTLGIIAGVILGLGTLSLLYLPLNFALSKLFNADINISAYAPDQMLLATNINVWAALAEGVGLTVIFLFLTIRFVNRRDVQ